MRKREKDKEREKQRAKERRGEKKSEIEGESETERESISSCARVQERVGMIWRVQVRERREGERAHARARVTESLSLDK